MNASINGSCHCGRVTWQAELPQTIILNCHCNMCRQLSGADYSSWVVVPTEKYQVTEGADLIKQYQATPKFSKSFCSLCGSTVSCVNNDKFPDHTYVARGNILDQFEFPADIQVYTADKASWSKLNEDIPNYNP